MTTLDDLDARLREPYTLDDPGDALAWLHIAAQAAPAQAGNAHIATRTLLPLVDESREPARELPSVFIDSDGDIMLGVHGREYSEDEEAVARSCGLILEDGPSLLARHTTEDLERVRDFLDAAVRVRRNREHLREKVRTQHAAAIDALRAAGWMVREP